MDNSVSRHPEFRYKTEFQSHEPEAIFSSYLAISAQFFTFQLNGFDIIFVLTLYLHFY